MCYTGACEYETYPYGVNEGCICMKPKGQCCPLEEEEEEEEEVEHPCPECGWGMIESIMVDNAGGSHRERNGWYCERCDYSEVADV